MKVYLQTIWCSRVGGFDPSHGELNRIWLANRPGEEYQEELLGIYEARNAQGWCTNVPSGKLT